MSTFSLQRLLELEEEKCTITIIILEITKSVIKISENNKKFKIYSPRYWKDSDTIEKLKEIIEQRNSKDLFFACRKSQRKKFSN